MLAVTAAYCYRHDRNRLDAARRSPCARRSQPRHVQRGEISRKYGGLLRHQELVYWPGTSFKVMSARRLCLRRCAQIFWYVFVLIRVFQNSQWMCKNVFVSPVFVICKARCRYLNIDNAISFVTKTCRLWWPASLKWERIPSDWGHWFLVPRWFPSLSSQVRTRTSAAVYAGTYVLAGVAAEDGWSGHTVRRLPRRGQARRRLLRTCQLLGSLPAALRRASRVSHAAARHVISGAASRVSDTALVVFVCVYDNCF